MSIRRILTVVLTLAAISLPVYAQGDPAGPPGPGQGGRAGSGDRSPQRDRARSMQQLAPEKAEAAWKLEAAGMAKGLGLSEEAASILVSAYVKARQSVREGLDKLRSDRPERDDRPQRGDRPPRGAGRGAPGASGGSGAQGAQGAQGQDDDTGRPQRRRPPGASGQTDENPRGDQQEKRNELLATAKKKLQADLTGILAGAQLEYAVTVLGTFSGAWDVMVDAIAGFKLGEEKTYAALKPIEVHIAETATLERGPSQDRGAGMQARSESRQKLLDAMKGLLDDEQYAAFQRAVPGGRTRGQGMSGMLERYDENGDGKLQRSEVPEQMLRMFDRLDANGDDALDEEELQAGGRRGRGGAGGAGGRSGGRGPDAP